MKSYDRLYEKLFTSSNRWQAANAITKSKRIRRIMKNRHWSVEVVASYLSEWIEHPEIWLAQKHDAVYRWDRSSKKYRKIFVPSLEELAIQHTVVQILWPIIAKGMFENTFGAVPNKGPLKVKKKIEKWIAKDRAGCKYCFKGDVYHFYASINRDKMFAICRKHIHDPKFLLILWYLIYSASDENCLLLGNYISGPLSMWYLQDFDHFVAQELKPKHYERWADDIVMFDSNKKKLHRIAIAVNEYLNTMDLRLKDNWQVFRFSYIDENGHDCGRALDFIGFKFYRNRAVLRKSIMLHATRTAKRIGRKLWPTIYDARQMEAYKGWLKHSDTYNMAKEHIYPYVNFKRLEKKTSRKQKEEVEYIYKKIASNYGYKPRTFETIYNSTNADEFTIEQKQFANFCKHLNKSRAMML